MPSTLSFSRKVRFGGTMLIVAGALALSGCGKKAPPQLPPEPGPSTTTSSSSSSGGYDSTVAAPGSQADFVAKMMGADTIYFDTDKYNIDAQDQVALQRQAQWLIQYPSKRATVEGHSDERGTREYNLALGERRANAAKNYLVSLGVDASRVTTISFGKERPIALGSDAQAWAQNRRAITVTID